MTRQFDEVRTIKALDRLFKENEELKSRVSIMERLYNDLFLKVTREDKEKKDEGTAEQTGDLYEPSKQYSKTTTRV